MNKLISSGLIAMLCGVGIAASAQTTTTTPSATMKSTMTPKDGMAPKDGMGMQAGMKMDMKMMDTNGDGKISKAEYNKYHALMWTKMKKDKGGMVGMSDMQMMMKDSHSEQK